MELLPKFPYEVSGGQKQRCCRCQGDHYRSSAYFG